MHCATAYGREMCMCDFSVITNLRMQLFKALLQTDLVGCNTIAQWASPLLLLGRSHLYRFIQIFLKFAKIYDKILKIFVKNWPDQILVKAQSKESKMLPPHYSEKVKTKIQQSPGQPGWGIWGKSGSAVLVFKRNGQKLNCYFSKLQNCCETIKR